MNQEYLTSAELNQSRQGVISAEEQKNSQSGVVEKEKKLEVNCQEAQNRQQQQSLQEYTHQKDIQGSTQVNTPPDPKKDFMGYVQWLGTELYKQGEMLSEQSSKQGSETEQGQLQKFYQQSIANVKQKYHDFDDAADFIYDTRATQLAAYAALYPEMADPSVVDRVIGHELKQILHDCMKKNQNPGEVIYSIAQKIGYTGPQNNIGQNPQQVQNAARTLAAHNGSAPAGPLSLDMLDKMSEREFSNWVSDPKNKAAFNRLMGGREI